MAQRKNRTVKQKSPATRGRKQKSRMNGSNPYVNMVVNPCSSTLVPGLYGSSEGLLARLKTSRQPKPTDPASRCGYVLWCPDYSDRRLNNAGDASQQGNLFEWNTEFPSENPRNTTGLPYGSASTSASAGEAFTLDDPAARLLESDIVADARVLSACMQMTYFGKLQDSAGEVGFISNLPVGEVLTGGIQGQPASVDDLMAFVTNKHRLGVDTLENVYRPNELSSQHFRSKDDTLLNVPLQGQGPTTVSQSTETLSPRLFGFVWRNVEPNAGLVFDFTKCIEWRAVPSSGLTQTPIHSIGPSLVPHIAAVVDHHNRRTGKNLWERIKTGIGSAMSEISKIAFGGTSGGFLRKGLDWLVKEGMGAGLRSLPSIAMDAAPLMLL